MIRDPEKTALLIAQLEKEYVYIEENFGLNHKAWERILRGSQDDLDWAALGYTLHVLYTSMENYFLRNCTPAARVAGFSACVSGFVR